MLWLVTRVAMLFSDMCLRAHYLFWRQRGVVLSIFQLKTADILNNALTKAISVYAVTLWFHTFYSISCIDKSAFIYPSCQALDNFIIIIIKAIIVNKLWYLICHHRRHSNKYEKKTANISKMIDVCVCGYSDKKK